MSVEDWAEVRRLHRSERMPIEAIARVLVVGRNTVRRALPAEGQTCYAGIVSCCSDGCVPRVLVWDNNSAVGKWRCGKPELTASMNAFRGMLGIKIVLGRPADPEAAGLVERANGYLETSFLPGRSEIALDKVIVHRPTDLVVLAAEHTP